MNKSRRQTGLYMCIAGVLIAALLSAGCINILNPLPHEVMVRENVISVDPAYVSSSLILTLLAAPNSYEPEMFSAIDAYLPRSKPVVEAGAGIGAQSAYINDRLEVRNGDHIAVEANPYLFDGLNKTKDTNRLGTQFINAAIAYSGDTTGVIVSTNLFETSVTNSKNTQTVTVPATTIDRLILTSSFPDINNVTLILDVGGTEHTIISNEENLSDYVAVIIASVSSNGKNTPDTFAKKLTALGYTLIHRSEPDTYDSVVMVFERA
ncbi:MAG: FkbM family methyltransferase [Methanocorpusculum sp.]|nr:FkbM family methyltransferase [Methanocorpusculum sp.]